MGKCKCKDLDEPQVKTPIAFAGPSLPNAFKKLCNKIKNLEPDQIDIIFLFLIAGLMCSFLFFWWGISALGIVL